MKEKEQASPENDNTDNRLEAVRDLLFGPNDQEYRKEFQGIKDQIASTQQDSSASVSKLEEELVGKIDQLEKKVLERISALESRVDELDMRKTDRKQLAALLQTIAKELES